MHGDRRFYVVVKNPPISEQESPDMQLEKRVAPRSIGESGPRRRGHVGRSVLIHADVYVRLLHHQLIQRNSAAPKGIDAQARLHFLCGKKRFRAGGFLAVDYQVLYGYPHGEPFNGKRAELHLAAGQQFHAAYRQPAQQRIAGAAAEENDQSRGDQKYFCGKNPDDVAQPAPLPAASLLSHFAASSRNFSMCSRALLSMSH